MHPSVSAWAHLRSYRSPFVLVHYIVVDFPVDTHACMHAGRHSYSGQTIGVQQLQQLQLLLLYLGLYSFSCHDSIASMQKGWVAAGDAERSSSQLLAFDTCHIMQSLQITKGTSCVSYVTDGDAFERGPPTSLTMMRIFKFSTGSSNRQYLVGIAVATQRDNKCSSLLLHVTPVTVNSGRSPSGILYELTFFFFNLSIHQHVQSTVSDEGTS